MKEREPDGDSLSTIKINKSLNQRLFESVLEDIKSIIRDFRFGVICENTVISMLRDYAQILDYLRSDGALQKALERSELALFKALFDDVENSRENLNV